MRESRAFAFLMLFPLGWIAWSLAECYLTTTNSDCSYAVGEPCTLYARYEQTILIWRGICIQMAAILAFNYVRKSGKCSKKS